MSAGRAAGQRRGTARGAGGSVTAPKRRVFSPKEGALPSLIRVMASSFLPPLFPLSSSSNPDPAGDKTPSAVAGTETVPAFPGRVQHPRPPSPHRPTPPALPGQLHRLKLDQRDGSIPGSASGSPPRSPSRHPMPGPADSPPPPGHGCSRGQPGDTPRTPRRHPRDTPETAPGHPGPPPAVAPQPVSSLAIPGGYPGPSRPCCGGTGVHWAGQLRHTGCPVPSSSAVLGA